MNEIKEIKPDKDIMEIIKTIIAQNGKILESNTALIEKFLNPLIYIPLSKKEK